jgi:hypothetical protein
VGLGFGGEERVSPGFVRGVIGHEVFWVLGVYLVHFTLVGWA